MKINLDLKEKVKENEMSVHKLKAQQNDEQRLIKDVVEAELLIKTLENCKSHEQVILAMEKFGYKLTKEGLDHNMKEFIESNESLDGVPEWVRLRARAMVHD